MFSGTRTTSSPYAFSDFHVFVVHDDGSQTIGKRPRDLGRGIRDAVSDVGKETANVAVLHQTGNTIRNIVEQACGQQCLNIRGGMETMRSLGNKSEKDNISTDMRRYLPRGFPKKSMEPSILAA